MLCYLLVVSNLSSTLFFFLPKWCFTAQVNVKFYKELVEFFLTHYNSVYLRNFPEITTIIMTTLILCKNLVKEQDHVDRNMATLPIKRKEKKEEEEETRC